MEKLKALTQGNFAKNVIVLTGGAVFAQALNFLVSPIITRIYSPSDYGIMTIYAAVLAIISLLGSLSYELAIPIAEDDKKAINIFSLCILILSVLSVIMAIVLHFFGEEILGILDAAVILKYKYFIPVGFFSIGFYTVASSWAFRKKTFKTLAKTAYSQSIVGNAAKIGLGVFTLGPMGLILGRILSESAGVFTLMIDMVRGSLEDFKKISFKDMFWVAKRYKKFPFFSAPTLLLTSMSAQVPTIFMSKLYGSQMIGLYGLAFGVTYLPVTIIGKAVQDVFYGESASLSRSNPIRIKELADKLMMKLIVLIGIPLLILMLFGPQLFSIVFGEAWREAGVYSRLISISTFAYFIFHPLTSVFTVFEEQKQLFYLNVAKLIVVIIWFQATKSLNLGAYVAVIILNSIMAALDFVKYLMAQKILKTSIRSMESDIN